jgi:hypothetical protein
MNRDELMNELQEQARLVGMGAEREMALRAEIDRLMTILRMLEAVDFGRGEWTDAAERAAIRARALIRAQAILKDEK